MGEIHIDSKKNLILLEREGRFSDKTEDIVFCHFDSAKGIYRIKFKSREKVYPYSRSKVICLEIQQNTDCTDKIIYIKEQLRNDVTRIYDFGSYVKVCFDKGTSIVSPKEDVTISNSCLSNSIAKNCFNYLKELAKLNIIRNDNEELSEDVEEASLTESESESSFLEKQYNKIDKIDERSSLGLYLMKTEIKGKPWQHQVLFPFGFNISQKTATEKAFKYTASIIEGPPGTGKTQTILNIIANAVLAGKTIAVVSNNNAAVKNVQEKLQKNGLDFISAFLGNSKNRKVFFASQTEEYPNLKSWKLEKNEFNKLKREVIRNQDRLNELLEKQNRSALLRQELSDLLTERYYFDELYVKNGSPKFEQLTVFKLKAQKISSLLVRLELAIEQNRINGFLNKVTLFIRYGFYNFKEVLEHPNQVILYLHHLYYDSKITKINKEIDVLMKALTNFNFDELAEQCSSTSMQLLKAELSKRYLKKEKRPKFQDCRSQEFISEYPVILSTTFSLRNCIQENYLFDYLIIDESSQVDIVTGALALSCGRNVVIVGDSKQLPQIISNEIKNQCKEMFKNSSLLSAYDYVDQSLLSSFRELYRDKIPSTLLREHYRCHPKIIGFCNRKFYDNQLIILTVPEQDDAFQIYYTVPGNHQRRIKNSVFNDRQIDVIFNEVLYQQSDFLGKSIGIVTPYNLQVRKIRARLESDSQIESDTVHKYQGREKDIMIMSTVVKDLNRFVDNPNLINVAVSRAISKFIVVTDKNAFLKHGTNIGDLLRYMKYNAKEEDVIQSKIVSVFDLLYSEYSNQLRAVLRKIRHKSKYKSENLMDYVIAKVLQRQEFKSFKHVLHVPLNKIIKEVDQLTEEERKYAIHELTHVDFLIYNKLDMSPVLAVEVDGFEFHDKKPERQKKDALKDKILEMNYIPVLRVKTYGSDEENKLIYRLNEIIAKSEVYE